MPTQTQRRAPPLVATAALPSGTPPPQRPQQQSWWAAWWAPQPAEVMTCRAGAAPPDGSMPAEAAPAAPPVVTRAALAALRELHRRPPALRRLRVKGDGACMFRSLAQGDALLRTGALLPEAQEWAAAQQLRADVVDRLREQQE